MGGEPNEGVSSRVQSATGIRPPRKGNVMGSIGRSSINQEAGPLQTERSGAASDMVDTKKKELLGQYRNGGRWRPQGRPEEVGVRLPGQGVGHGGVYDLVANEGWVSVGVDHDTAAFAVETIRRWWRQMGWRVYGGAQRLLITADGGGSNASRNRLWKLERSGSPMSWGWRYRCAMERASGTRSSTGCSVTLPRTGVDARW